MAVMNMGKFIEFGPSEQIYQSPREDYTRKLISAIPKDTLAQIERRQIERLRAQDAET